MSGHILHDLPSTETLRAFIIVARRGSLSAAALDLGVTHGAISRRIQALQSWLGIALFERHGRGLRLTPTGEHFLRRTERSLSDIASLAADLRVTRDPRAVRLNVLPSFARLWLLPRIPTLEGDPKDAQLHISTEHRVSSFEMDETDLAVRYGQGEWPGTTAQLLFNESHFPIATPSIARKLRKRPLSKLFDECLIHNTGSDWHAWLRHAQIKWSKPRCESRFTDYDMALQAAVLGQGVVLARSPLSDAAIANGSLVRLPGPALTSDRAHYMVMRERETRGPILRVAQRLLSQAATT